MAHRLKRKGEDWRQRLPRPIIVQNGKELATLGDCREYAINLDSGEAALPHWHHAVKLMLQAAKGGSLEEVALQFERILFQRGMLVLSEAPNVI